MFPPNTRILIIDDMPSIRDLVRNHLKAIGFSDITEAGDGEAALKLMVQQKSAGTPFGLIISDWNMPALSGLDLLKQVRATAEWKELPFVLLTSESERDEVTEAVMAGVSQYVVKPFAAKIFEEKLKAAFDKHKK